MENRSNNIPTVIRQQVELNYGFQKDFQDFQDCT